MKTNLFIAGAITLALALWMIAGPLIANNENADGKDATQLEERDLPSVRIRASKAEPHVKRLTLRGKTLAAREVILRAELSGTVDRIARARGQAVKKGELILGLDLEDLPEHIEAATASLAQRTLERQAAQRLESTGYQSETRLAEAEAQLRQAEAQLAQLQNMMANKEIRAPFDGYVNDRLVEIGAFLSPGDPVVEFLELAPLIIEAEATEKEIQSIEVGEKGIGIIGTDRIEGRIRFLSRVPNPETRTYTLELEIPNGDLAYQPGLTADIEIPIEARMAHLVSPALLILSANSEGDLGLKTVNAANEVAFHKTRILSGDADGVWVEGLPDQVDIITVGQGFVKPGARVKAVKESSIQE